MKHEKFITELPLYTSNSLLYSSLEGVFKTLFDKGKVKKSNHYLNRLNGPTQWVNKIVRRYGMKGHFLMPNIIFLQGALWAKMGSPTR